MCTIIKQTGESPTAYINQLYTEHVVRSLYDLNSSVSLLGNHVIYSIKRYMW
jgi:hypothetical protein